MKLKQCLFAAVIAISSIAHVAHANTIDTTTAITAIVSQLSDAEKKKLVENLLPPQSSTSETKVVTKTTNAVEKTKPIDETIASIGQTVGQLMKDAAAATGQLVTDFFDTVPGKVALAIIIVKVLGGVFAKFFAVVFIVLGSILVNYNVFWRTRRIGYKTFETTSFIWFKRPIIKTEYEPMSNDMIVSMFLTNVVGLAACVLVIVV